MEIASLSSYVTTHGIISKNDRGRTLAFFPVASPACAAGLTGLTTVHEGELVPRSAIAVAKVVCTCHFCSPSSSALNTTTTATMEQPTDAANGSDSALHIYRRCRAVRSPFARSLARRPLSRSAARPSVRRRRSFAARPPLAQRPVRPRESKKCCRPTGKGGKGHRTKEVRDCIAGRRRGEEEKSAAAADKNFCGGTLIIPGGTRSN